MTLPYTNSGVNKKQQVQNMFNNIAPRYDFLNHFLSLGIDKLWRKKAIRIIRHHFKKHQPANTCILDVATGTGDLAILAAKLSPKQINGIDISEEMLEIGKKKIRKKNLQNLIQLKYGDAENIDFPDESFDALTIAFGVRNFENKLQGMSEMCRVLKPNGIMVVLELSVPIKFPVKQLYLFYFLKILPLLGKFYSKDHSAYRYLPASVLEFPHGKKFEHLAKKSGFSQCSYKTLSFSTVHLYECIK